MRRILFSTILVLAAAGWAFAQTSYSVRQANMSIAGTSSLHDWESQATTVTARGRINYGSTLESIPELVVTVRVRDIKSTKGSIMDNKTYDALKADSHPTITYRLTRVKSIQPTTKGFTVNAEGQLTIAGVTKTIEMAVEGYRQSDGAIVFQGSKPLKMSNFGISPPTAMMGTLKTGDDITIRFKVTMAPAN